MKKQKIRAIEVQTVETTISERKIASIPIETLLDAIEGLLGEKLDRRSLTINLSTGDYEVDPDDDLSLSWMTTSVQTGKGKPKKIHKNGIVEETLG